MKNAAIKTSYILLLAAFALIFAAAPGAAFAQRKNISGKLAPTVEGGGWTIIAGQTKKPEKYLLLNAEKFSGEKWFREGARVSATGNLRRGAITIYQEGIPYEARTLRLLKSAVSRRRPRKIH